MALNESLIRFWKLPNNGFGWTFCTLWTKRPACQSSLFYAWEVFLQEIEADAQSSTDVASLLSRQVSSKSVPLMSCIRKCTTWLLLPFITRAGICGVVMGSPVQCSKPSHSNWFEFENIVGVDRIIKYSEIWKYMAWLLCCLPQSVSIKTQTHMF